MRALWQLPHVYLHCQRARHPSSARSACSRGERAPRQLLRWQVESRIFQNVAGCIVGMYRDPRLWDPKERSHCPEGTHTHTHTNPWTVDSGQWTHGHYMDIEARCVSRGHVAGAAGGHVRGPPVHPHTRTCNPRCSRRGDSVPPTRPVAKRDAVSSLTKAALANLTHAIGDPSRAPLPSSPSTRSQSTAWFQHERPSTAAWARRRQSWQGSR